MTIVLAIFLPLLIIIFLLAMKMHVNREMNPKVKFSYPSKELLKQYDNLPEDNRPFRRSELEEVLLALDIKYDKGESRKHFFKGGGYWEFPRCECYWFQKGTVKCFHMKEYIDLYKQMKSITDAIKAQKHALAMTNATDGLNKMEELTEAMRQEQQIITDVTEQFIREV